MGAVALLEPKGSSECRRARPREPHERSWDEISLTGFQEKKAVEGVRNPKDGMCRRMEAPGHTGSWNCRTLKGTKSQERCTRDSAPRCG